MPPPPTDPPRPWTAAASRRAWTEPTVRPWWLTAAVVLLAVVGYAVGEAAEVVPRNRLIAGGTAVAAQVERTIAHQIAGQSADAGDNVNVTFDWHGQRHTANGDLTRSTTVKATIPIRVDPANPDRWTDQPEPTPLLPTLVIGLIALPVVPILMGVAWVRRRAVSLAYRRGRAAVGVVSDRRAVPVAPLSHAVRCSLRDGGDRRLHTVYVPRGTTAVAKGDALWLLLPPAGRGRPVAAAWFG